jgi:DNA-binding helix-turn-helix protein
MIKCQITGDNSMLADYLRMLKEKKNVTNQELSDLSGVPIGTINRIMARQTDNPSFQTVCDIVIALDGSLDDLAGIKSTVEKEGHNTALSMEMVQMYRHIIATKDKWIHRLFICLCCLIVFILVVLIADLSIPSLGFFRR